MRRRYCSQGARGRGVGRVSTDDVRYLLLGQETLDKVPLWSSGPREEGEGPDGGCGERACSKSNCRRGWGMWSASPVDAGFGGTQGSALLRPIHHVDESSHVKSPICQEPATLAGIHCFSSCPSSVHLVPSTSFTHVSETRHLWGTECSSSLPLSEPHSLFLNP